jgi:hypothetical protein
MRERIRSEEIIKRFFEKKLKKKIKCCDACHRSPLTTLRVKGKLFYACCKVIDAWVDVLDNERMVRGK